MSALGYDFEFDVDLGDELNLVAFAELSWANAKATRTLTQITRGISQTQESTSLQEGQLFGFEAFTLGTGASNVTFTFARMTFATNPEQVRSDGFDLFSTNERDPFVCQFSTIGCLEPFLPIGARVELIPEPSTITMLVVGIALLARATLRR